MGVSCGAFELMSQTLPDAMTQSRVALAEQGAEKSSEKSSEKILALLLDQPSLSAKALAITLGLSPRGVEKLLAKLRHEGRLERVGAAKGGYWRVIARG